MKRYRVLDDQVLIDGNHCELTVTGNAAAAAGYLAQVSDADDAALAALAQGEDELARKLLKFHGIAVELRRPR